MCLTQSLTALTLAAAAMLAFAQDGSSEESSQGERESSIGYPSVAAALESLRVRSDVKIREEHGWTVVTDPTANTIWSFTPVGHPAHPAAVKRILIERDGAILMEMKALCQAPKAPCDKLIEDFKVLNEKARRGIKGNQGIKDKKIQK